MPKTKIMRWTKAFFGNVRALSLVTVLVAMVVGLYELNKRSHEYNQKALIAHVLTLIERDRVNANPYDLVYRQALYKYNSECEQIYTTAARYPWLRHPTLPREPSRREFVLPQPPNFQLVLGGRIVEISVDTD
jgi:hypothetical protein